MPTKTSKGRRPVGIPIRCPKEYSLSSVYTVNSSEGLFLWKKLMKLLKAFFTGVPNNKINGGSVPFNAVVEFSMSFPKHFSMTSMENNKERFTLGASL